MRPSAIPAALLVLLAGCSSQQPASDAGASATPGAVSAEPSIVPGAISFHDVGARTDLEPGTYVLRYADVGGAEDFPTLEIAFTVPANWARVQIDGVVWHDVATPCPSIPTWSSWSRAGRRRNSCGSSPTS